MANRNFEVSFTGWVATAPNTYKYDPENPAKCLCVFTAIHTPRYKSNSGEWQEKESLRIQVKCWGWQALYVNDSIHVGDPIVAIGRLERTKWIDAKGEERYGMELTATTVGHDLSFGKSRFFRMQGGMPRNPESYQKVFSPLDNDNLPFAAGIYEEPNFEYVEGEVGIGNTARMKNTGTKTKVKKAS